MAIVFFMNYRIPFWPWFLFCNMTAWARTLSSVSLASVAALSLISSFLLQTPQVTPTAAMRPSSQTCFLMLLMQTALRYLKGKSNNIDLFSRCVRGSCAVFLAVTMNDNIPGVTVAQDTARTLFPALEPIRVEKQCKMPKIVVLPSSSPEA